MERTDVVVIGAGPAGSAAAITLCRAGLSVTVADKATFPRDKCCGDGLTTLALRELEALGFRPHGLTGWREVDAAWLRSPSGREIRVPLPQGRGTYAATVPRRELDHALLAVARAAGASVVEGAALTGLTQLDDGVTVTIGDAASSRTLVARFVIAADGMWSPTRKLAGRPEQGDLGEWHAVRQYAAGVTGTARDRMHVWFEPDLLPGYMWSFPLPDGRANIGFGVLRDSSRSGAELRRLWDDLLSRPHIHGALGEGHRLEGRHMAWPIPARIDRVGLHDGRVLYAGDAAKATDLLTGEGIGQALLTGRLAAEAIVAAGTAPDAAAGGAAARRRYSAAVRHHLLADHRMSVLLGRALTHRRGANGAIRVLATSAWARRNFARWMFEDEPRAIAFTPRRWHRRFLRRDGAYAGPPPR